MIFGKKLNISLIESDVIWNDKKANLQNLEEKLTFIPKGTDIVVLPELFSTGFYIEQPNEMRELAERNTEDTILTLKRLAKEYNVAITGSFMARTADRIFNRAFFVESSGDETYYDKRHTFNIGGEQEVFTSGNKKPHIIRYRGWNILLSVCYDLRFPVWLRNIDCKYDLLIVVANWPKARDYVWQHLLIARALENQCYVCGCNRIGNSPSGIEYIGNSMILDFRGKVIANAADNNAIITASLSSDKLRSFRESFPVWKDFDEFELRNF
jgi:predicted amidohydrolase